MSRKIIHGDDNFGYAMIKKSEEGTYSFDTPEMLPGMKSSKIEVEESSTKVHADNIVFGIITGQKVRTAEATVLYIPEKYYTDCLGYKANKNGTVTDTGTKKAHCFFFTSNETDLETGEKTKSLHYIYDATATEPSLETNTDEDEIEPAELTISYESKTSDFVVDDDNKKVGYARITRTEENKTWFDTFTTKVLLPTDVVQQTDSVEQSVQEGS